MKQQALEGVKVVAFTWLVAGPLIAKYLADHGATVIRVEYRFRCNKNLDPASNGDEYH